MLQNVFFLVTLPEFFKFLLVLAISLGTAIKTVPSIIPELKVETPYMTFYLVPCISGFLAALIANRFVNGIFTLFFFVCGCAAFIYFR